MEHIEIILLFFVIASVYSSVGFGGGSSYLALLSLYSFHFTQIRAIALLCNLVVVSAGVFFFARRGYVDLKKIIPIIVLSIPMAYIGGRVRLEPSAFFILLGASLVVTAVVMWLQSGHDPTWEEEAIKKRKYPAIQTGAVGGSVGLLAGLVGIGGGIFLAPVLHVLRWDTPKKIAATASLFILLNSAAGLAGQFQNTELKMDWSLALPLLIAVFLGGQLGSRMGSGPFSQRTVKRVTAIVILAAGLRVLWKYLI